VTTAPRFSGKTLLSQSLITGIALSPDGDTLVYSRRTIEKGKYRSRLWRVAVEGGRAEQLTHADAMEGGPRISPNGRSLLFVSNRKDEKVAQLWIMPLDGGEPRMIPGFPDGVSSAEWSPDGKRLLVLAPGGVQRYIAGKKDDPTARVVNDVFWRLDGEGILDQVDAVWVANANGTGKPKRRTEPDIPVVQAIWSPDGRRIAFRADRGPERTTLPLEQAWSIPAEGGKPRPLVAFEGTVVSIAWGGGGVAFTAFPRGLPTWQNVQLRVADGRTTRQLGADLDRPAMVYGGSELVGGSYESPIVWLGDDHVATVVTDRGVAAPWRFGLDGSVKRLVDEPVTCVALAAEAGRLVTIAAVDGAAAEAYEVEGGRLRPITRNNARWFSPYRRPSEPVRVPAAARKPAVHGWLLRARGSRGIRPLVFHIHGGPHSAVGPTPLLEDVALADAGFHVVRLNARGSVSYGEEHARTLHGVWGDPDSEDLLRTIDWAVRTGLADRDRIGLSGLSYGGYMVHLLLANFPGTFKAAVSENPLSDMVADLGAGDSSAYLDEGIGLGSFPDKADSWHARSSIYRIHRNHAPLLLLQADDDLRCPPVQSEIPFAILKLRGRTVEMVRYPGESHVMLLKGRPDRRVDRIDRIVGWFETYLR
jgi:dipeptidyl aminopeptidase/acylaminoacyl peptidase